MAEDFLDNRYSIEQTDKGFTIAIDGNLTGQSYSDQQSAEDQILVLKEIAISKEKAELQQQVEIEYKKYFTNLSLEDLILLRNQLSTFIDNQV